MTVGVAATFVLAVFSLVRVSPSGISYRSPQIWSNEATLLLSQKGFSEGRSVVPQSAPPPEQRFATLVELYTELATSDAVVAALAPRSEGVYLDVTLGGGGHAEAILVASSPGGTLLGIDRDPRAREFAARRLVPFGARARVRAGTMSGARSVLQAEGIEHVDGLVADLGVSSPQIDDPARGMSFRTEGPLEGHVR